MDRLKGKVAIITGAAGGICHKASELFCQEGAKVVMVDIDPQVEQFSAEINANGGESIAVVADVAQRDTWVQLKKLADAKYGRIDTVVLIVSDTDYTPLMRKLTGLGLRIMLLSWEFEYVNDDGVKMVTKTSHELLSLATYPVAMHDVINYGVQQNNPLISEMFVAPDPSRQAREQTFETSEILSLKNGFGFIKYPNNNLFFHYQDVVGEFADLNVGDPVEFTIEQNQQKQDVAKNVRKLLPSEIKKIAKKGAGL